MREHRPRDLTPAQIGFTRQKPVPWLNPGLLAGTAARVLLAHWFGGYLDKRELQAVLPSATHDHSERDELWIDYTADIGDGFDATYTVAYLLAQPHVDAVDPGTGEADDEAGASGEGNRPGSTGVLPRSDVLVLGGDQVYPTASATSYQNRCKGPYSAALPEPGPDSPTMYAIPGNHDWYDGLTSFLRLFGQRDPIGGWKTQQGRSYFALELPHRWWLLAIDIQLSSYIDEPQLEYFQTVAEGLGPDDRIILCSAKPAWVMTEENPDAYDSIDYFVRSILEPTGARIPLLLAGDMHHYARYVQTDPDTDLEPEANSPGRQLITCGGGGAYLVGTGHLPSQVTVPPPATTIRKASKPQNYRLVAAYPDRPQSRRLGWSIFARLPWRNPGFVGLVGLVQTLLMLALLAAEDGHWVNAATGITVSVVVAGTLLFATLSQSGRRQWIAGGLHALPHIGLGIVGAAAWSAQPLADVPSPWDTLLAFVVYLPIAGLVDSWIVGAYLLVARYANVNVNELYAGLGIENYKSFLRMHIGRDGSLTIHPITVEQVSRSWRADPDAAREAPWIVPNEPPRTRLAEPPITIR